MTQIIARTDQTGANDPISLGNSRIFNFSLTSSYDLYSGLFSMKRGSSSTDGITAAVHNAINGGGSVIASVFIAAASFNQTFTDMEFLFSDFPLSPGVYSLVLSSNTPTGGSTNYFIKSGNFQITDKETGSLLSSGYAIDASLSSESTLNGDAFITHQITADLVDLSYLLGALTGGSTIAPKRGTAKSRIGHYTLTSGIHKRIWPYFPFWTTRRNVTTSITPRNPIR